MEKLSCPIDLQTICQITNSLWRYCTAFYTKCFQRLEWTSSMDQHNLCFTWIGSMTSVMTSTPASLIMLNMKSKLVTVYQIERLMCRLLLWIACLPDAYSILQPINTVQSEKLYNGSASASSQSIRKIFRQRFKKIAKSLLDGMQALWVNHRIHTFQDFPSLHERE